MEFYEGRPWAKSAFLIGERMVQHGALDTHTLCGIPRERYEVTEHPFFGNESHDCPACAEEFHRLDSSYKDARP